MGGGADRAVPAPWRPADEASSDSANKNPGGRFRRRAQFLRSHFSFTRFPKKMQEQNYENEIRNKIHDLRRRSSQQLIA
jgi:hypothetical protein